MLLGYTILITNQNGIMLAPGSLAWRVQNILCFILSRGGLLHVCLQLEPIGNNHIAIGLTRSYPFKLEMVRTRNQSQTNQTEATGDWAGRQASGREPGKPAATVGQVN